VRRHLHVRMISESHERQSNAEDGMIAQFITQEYRTKASPRAHLRSIMDRGDKSGSSRKERGAKTETLGSKTGRISNARARLGPGIRWFAR